MLRMLLRDGHRWMRALPRVGCEVMLKLVVGSPPYAGAQETIGILVGLHFSFSPLSEAELDELCQQHTALFNGNHESFYAAERQEADWMIVMSRIEAHLSQSPKAGWDEKSWLKEAEGRIGTIWGLV